MEIRKIVEASQAELEGLAFGEDDDPMFVREAGYVGDLVIVAEFDRLAA